MKRHTLILFLLILSSRFIWAQPSNTNPVDTVLAREPGNGEYDEILITLNVPRIGSVEIPAVIYQEMAYLPVKELFDFLIIRNNLSEDQKTIEGFFMDPKATYSIDKKNKLIIYAGNRFELSPADIIITETNFYLRAALYGRVFGLYCQFNFRSLSVNLNTSIELPALREMKLENMRKNMSHLKGEKKADTTINRSFSLFRPGMIDWSVISTQDANLKNIRVTMGVGAALLGGEANIFINYYNDRPLKMKDHYYFWRNVNNARKLLRQVIIGKILPNPASTIYDGVVGFQINNTPTTYRRSFGSYMLSEKTEPNWTVELYVNNVLVNYTKADASGFFTFEVPMVYGNSVVKLRYYGPFGEEKTQEQNLSIPFNFLPEKQFEYTISAGVVEDHLHSKFSRAQFNYGLTKRITIGGGVEYLSSLKQDKMPFLTLSTRIGSSLFLNGEYIHGVKARALASYRFASNLRIELNYLRYDKDQKAIRINFLDEKKLVISKSMSKSKYSAFTRFTLNQFSLANIGKRSTFTSAEWLLSTVVAGISSNLTSYVIIRESAIPLAYTNLSMNFQLKRGLNFLPQAQYEYNRKNFSLLKMEMEKSLFNRGYLNISYEIDIKNKRNTVGLGFRYNLSFAQASYTTRRSKQSSSSTEVVRGSVLLDAKTNYLGFNNQSNVGKGGLVIAPFLDLNANGKREKGEPVAPGLKLKINGGRIQRNERDSSVRVTGLDPYTTYYVELDKSGFDNIAWQITKPIIKITVDPNHFTYLPIPVSVMGEVSGTVYLNGTKGSDGIGRIVVGIYDKSDALVAKTITETDGFFSYLGLAPGDYIVRVDPDQLKKLNMSSTPGDLPINLKNTKEGDAVTNISIVLRTK